MRHAPQHFWMLDMINIIIPHSSDMRHMQCRLLHPSSMMEPQMVLVTSTSAPLAPP
jgi:hypothetical protein